MKKIFLVVGLVVLLVSGCTFGGSGDNKYEVIFVKDTGVAGEMPSKSNYKEGETFTLPNNTLTKEGY